MRFYGLREFYHDIGHLFTHPAQTAQGRAFPSEGIGDFRLLLAIQTIPFQGIAEVGLYLVLVFIQGVEYLLIPEFGIRVDG